MSAQTVMFLPPEVDAAIREHCASEYPNEACGAIFGDGDGVPPPWRVTGVVAAPNEHEGDHRRRYLVPPEFQLRMELQARASGQELLGYYHSHPDHPAQPSEYDRVHAWSGYIYMICSVRQGRPEDLHAFTLEEQGGAFLAVPIEVASGVDPTTSESGA
jgi:proteasome lid subunit RPN8/RPN11